MSGNEQRESRRENGEYSEDLRKRASGIIKAREDAEASIRKYRNEVERILQRSQHKTSSRMSLSTHESPRRPWSDVTNRRSSLVTRDMSAVEGSDHSLPSIFTATNQHALFSTSNLWNFLQAVTFGMLIGFLLIYTRLKYPEWKRFLWLSKGIECEHEHLDTCKGTMKIINHVFDELSRKTGRMVCAGMSVDAQLMSRIELETMLLAKRLLGRYTIKERVNELISLILMNPQWNIRSLDVRKTPMALNTSKESRRLADEVYYLYTDLATKPFLCRLEMAFWKVATLAAIGISVTVALATIVYVLKNYREQKQVFNRDCFDMIDRITDLLQRQKQDHIRDPNVPPYLALIHIHDTLIPMSKRNRLERVWGRAREVLGRWESRVRQENQLIDGEEYVVWRWIGRLPESRPATDTEE